MLTYSHMMRIEQHNNTNKWGKMLKYGEPFRLGQQPPVCLQLPVYNKILRSTTILRSTIKDKMASFVFMKLPRELRNKVYCVCLMVEGHVTPYPEWYCHDDSLDYKGDKITSFLPLLRVSRDIRQEASPIFFGKNVFRMTSRAEDLKYGGVVSQGFGVSTDASHQKGPSY